MYGGLVIPTRNMQPSGSPSSSVRISSGIDEPMSRPYAPVSSEVSHTSTTPSSVAVLQARVCRSPNQPNQDQCTATPGMHEQRAFARGLGSR